MLQNKPILDKKFPPGKKADNPKKGRFSKQDPKSKTPHHTL